MNSARSAGQQPTTLLRLSGVTKSFGGVRALRGVDFDLRAGEVHAILGENGAGKSTMIKIIAGAHAPDGGTIELLGQPLLENTPAKARALGINVIYQQPALFADLTVAENIGLRDEPPGVFRRIRWGHRRDRAKRLLARVGSSIDPNAEVRSLTMPQQQLVEIAAALGTGAKVLILDEPTASLGEQDAQNLFRVINELRSEGVGIVYISHRLDEVIQIADRVTVLRDGAYVVTRDAAGVTPADMIRLMVGRPLDAVFHKADVTIGDVVLETRGLGCREGGIHDVNLQVRAGEILGLAGLVGAGRTELARVLFGITPADAGEIRLRTDVTAGAVGLESNQARSSHGFAASAVASGASEALRPVTIRSPADAIASGLAYLPEDRRRHGVILELPVDANTTLAVLKQISSAGLIDFVRERSIAGDFLQKLGTKTAGLNTPVGHLSGGNQQKVALARWLATKPKVIVLDEPTQGVDVGAKAEIHKLIGELAAGGLAVLLISSELPEVLGVADRIAVMRGGTIVATLDRAEATQEKLLQLALHSTGEAAA